MCGRFMFMVIWWVKKLLLHCAKVSKFPQPLLLLTTMATSSVPTAPLSQLRLQQLPLPRLPLSKLPLPQPPLSQLPLPQFPLSRLRWYSCPCHNCRYPSFHVKVRCYGFRCHNCHWIFMIGKVAKRQSGFLIV